ncbi:MAG: translesion error-prone DNA polymerase V autoproteolytic subunit [Leptospiraceae bacterium]|nr:translesion error-prone DNA polymerase V autoproteolytic subunit [Leptospiraceae bacterium]MDW7976274.1 translesion error-prone DNA polymerase V autoproteolytic subunit [Leptospiraceae bacterium]
MEKKGFHPYYSRTYFKLDEELYNKLLPISYSGFPSPAEDFLERRIDLNSLLIRNPKATFFMKVQGNSYDQLIRDGDIIIIDCSLTPISGDYVIAVLEGEFLIRKIIKKNNKFYIINLNSEEIEIQDSGDFEIWGVITYVIHSTRK